MTSIIINGKTKKKSGNNEKTSCALGFFDGLHLGHANVIASALMQAEKLGVKPAVFTFKSGERSTRLPKMQTGEIILSPEQKLSMLSNMGVETVYSPDFSEIKNFSPKEFTEEVLLKRLSAVSVSCGYDFCFGKGGSGNALLLKELCEKKGVSVDIVSAVTIDGVTVSSTAIRSFIREGKIEAANKMLGYELYYVLPVITGQKLGRTLGTPTINQQIPTDNVMPRFGVYKSRASVHGQNFPAVTNIGLRPTVESGFKSPLMETHIIGYEAEDLYGEYIRVSLMGFIRDEKKYGSVRELKEQIRKDLEASLR